MICTTCNHPAEHGYSNRYADEQCCDPCHGPYLTPISSASSRFIKFHGKRKARGYMVWKERSAA